MQNDIEPVCLVSIFSCRRHVIDILGLTSIHRYTATMLHVYTATCFQCEYTDILKLTSPQIDRAREWDGKKSLFCCFVLIQIKTLYNKHIIKSWMTRRKNNREWMWPHLRTLHNCIYKARNGEEKKNNLNYY